MRRGLRWSCHVTAAAWIVALLVGARNEPRLPLPEAARAPVLARLRPLPEAAEAAEAGAGRRETPSVAPPAAPPEPPPLASRPPPLEPLEAGDLGRGGDLLAGGSFPVLSCRYDSFPSFLAYARAMTSLGARFVVVRRREIVGGIDLATGAIGAASLAGPFSPRARDYTGEPGLAALARGARQRFGSDAVVMMLVPRAIDAGLFGGIARVLAERGDRHADFREIQARYERSADGIRLRVEAGIRPDGTRVDLDVVFDLAALARAPGGRV